MHLRNVVACQSSNAIPDWSQGNISWCVKVSYKVPWRVGYCPSSGTTTAPPSFMFSPQSDTRNLIVM
ncbi:hypothetical protein Pmani_005191 [Petrolisthes manimaculis]|uniref:Uncharacterized protein n=1 Tax=Petrolisthes manimaculis TaxID=1843537 RepID=A0AAE1QC84_9EUCA|nr:hypothetical protein Pmani_005191 [Petrolisthes manimaculis]